MDPIVSVVVATYRREDTLQRALESLAKQTYKAMEIVLVDDNAESGWNERVRRVAEDFCRAHPDIRFKHLVNDPNLGSAKTRNRGIEASEGTYICFLDDDDLYLPDRIKNQLLPMCREEADYSITDLALYSETEKRIETRTRAYITDTALEAMTRYHLMYHITGTDTMMFRREYLLQIGCFSPINVGDEFYLMHKAIQHGGRFLYVPVCDVKAYVHTGEGGLSSGIGKIRGENELFAYKQQYFPELDRKTIRYIRMRHHAVLAFAHLRSGAYTNFLKECLLAFFCAPSACVGLLLKR